MNRPSQMVEKYERPTTGNIPHFIRQIKPLLCSCKVVKDKNTQKSDGRTACKINKSHHTCCHHGYNSQKITVVLTHQIYS